MSLSSKRVLKLQDDAIERLCRRTGMADIVSDLEGCKPGQCGHSHDACHIAAYNRWRLRQRPKLVGLFECQNETVCVIRLTSDSWGSPAKELQSVMLASVAKTIRRGFDRLEQPKIVAVGMAGAQFSKTDGRWSLTFELISRGVERRDLFDTWGKCSPSIEVVADAKAVLDGMFWSSRTPSTLADGQISKARRGEYYAWLATTPAGSRTLRYGCDRYFNALTKGARVRRPREPKRHPTPVWLAPYAYDSHDYRCTCSICAGRRH